MMEGVERDPILLVVTGPSGSGKTTVSQALRARHPELRRVVTCTTRPPRPGEREGVDYYFLSREEFLARIERGELIEHAEVYGQLYGVPRQELLMQLAEGADLILNVDVQGVRNLLHLAPSIPELQRALVTVFVTPASLDELKRRLQNRGTEDASTLRQRMAHAEQELVTAKECDYLLISRTPEEDLNRLDQIYQAERCRTHRIRHWPWERR